MKNTMKNTIIYIDYENIHTTLLHKKTNILRMGFFEKLKIWCEKSELRILDILAYSNFDLQDLYESHHQTKLQEYGINTIHTSNKGKNFADLKITTDMLETMYNNNLVDGFILISNDKDMTPLISQVKKYKDFMYLITVGNNYDKSVLSFPDKHITMDEINELEINSLNIDKLNIEVEDSLSKHLSNKIEKYENQNSSVHLGLEYYVNNSFSYFKVMKYEFVNIIKLLFEKNILFVYDYEYRKNKLQAIMLTKFKDISIQKGILTENDINTTYDFDLLIKEIYESYQKN